MIMIMGSSTSTQSEADTQGPIAQLVKDKIKDNKVMIFSKSYCPYCKNAKKVFKELNVPYETLELDKHPSGTQMQDILGLLTGAKTVPRVFINGECIGGCSETKEYLKNGKLQLLLQHN